MATHIVGGELNYVYLGSNRYEIRLTVYRDCFNGVPPFDDPAFLGIFNGSNTLLTSIQMALRTIDTLPSAINTPCFNAPLSICYEITTYIDTLVLPPSASGYKLVYQRCCRNQTILNINDPGATGAAYIATVPGSAVATNNSNPIFKNLPPSFVCVNAPFLFDHSAIDPDGDSLVYELCAPLSGGDQVVPQPQPPFNPPYAPPFNPVNWKSPYSLNNLFGGIPLVIDSNSGLLSAVPNTQGQFVYGVCVKEFRNGVYISETRRDFQANVIQCPTLLLSSFLAPEFQCGNTNVSFINQSIGAAAFHWDFGVTGSNVDTSNQISPNFTYPDTGTYTVTLIAYSAIIPGCTDTIKKIIKFYPELITSAGFSTDPCTYGVQFNDSTDLSSGPTTQWQWQFGDAGVSNTSDPMHVYPGAGIFNGQLIQTSTAGCKDTVVFSVDLKKRLQADQTTFISPDCFGVCNATATTLFSGGISPYIIQWNDPLNQQTQTASGLCAGAYQVSITDSNNCVVNSNININQPPLLTGSIVSSEAYCNGACIGTAFIATSGGTLPLTYQWNDTNLQTTAYATGLCQGVYNVIVRDTNGCIYSDSVTINSSSYQPSVSVFADPDTVFVGQTSQLTSNFPLPANIDWTPIQTLTSTTISNPIAFPGELTTYVLTITDSLGCSNSDSVTVYVKTTICRDPELFVPSAFSPNQDGKNDILFVRGNAIKELYFAVYDRWGELVFESNNKTIGWNGMHKGQEAHPGVYVYYLKAICFGESEFKYKGNVTLLR